MRIAKLAILTVVPAMGVLGLLVIVLLTFVFPSLLTRTAFVVWSYATAGISAINCGQVTLEDDPTSGVDCARSALDAKQPFVLIVQRQGIDSWLENAIVRNARSEIYRLDYDSAPCGSFRCLSKTFRIRCSDAHAELSPSRWQPGKTEAVIGCGSVSRTAP